MQQIDLLEEWAKLAPEECTKRGFDNLPEFTILTDRASWVVIEKFSSVIQWESVFFAILAFCKKHDWDVELLQRVGFYEAKISEITGQYNCITKFSESSIIEALLLAYVGFLGVKDTLDKPELLNEYH